MTTRQKKPSRTVYSHTPIEQVDEGLYRFVIESTLTRGTPCTCFHRGTAASALTMARSMIDNLHRRYFNKSEYLGTVNTNNLLF